MAGKSVSIRRYEKSDKEKVLELRKDVFGESNLGRQRAIWNWEYERNPNNDNGEPWILVAEADGEIVGMVGALAAKVKVGHRVEKAAWLVDYATHPRYRGVGYRLAIAVKKLGLLVIGFGNEVSSLLARKMKWFDISPVYTAVSILNMENLLLTKTSWKLVSKLGGQVWKVLSLFAGLRQSQTVKVEEVNGFGDWVDDLWRRTSSDYGIIAVRDKNFLNWRFADCPARKYTILVARENDRELGYMVVREETKDGLKRGRVVDFLTKKGDRETIESLLFQAVRHFEKANVDVITCIQPTSKALIRAFRKYGFIGFRNRGRVNVVGYGQPAQVDTDYFKNSQNWFLTQADSDIDFAE